MVIKRPQNGSQSTRQIIKNNKVESTVASQSQHSNSQPYTLKIPSLKKTVSLWVHDKRDQHVSRGIAEQGIWEAYETQLFLERIRPGINVVDVGANIGYYSVIAADQLAGTGFIAAFEPDPDNYHLLQKNLKHNQCHHVDAVHAGLAEHNGDGELFLNDSNFGDHQMYDAGQGRASRPIRLVNGADYFQEKIQHIDLLKIDTQGAESAVITGLLPLLQKSGDKLSMIIEFWPYGLRQSGSSAHQLIDMLITLKLPIRIIDHIGFDLVACTERQLREWVDMVETNPEDQGFMNILLGR